MRHPALPAFDMDHIVDRNPWAWQDARPTPLVLWLLWGMCALFCLSAAVNTGITGMTFGIPFAAGIASMMVRGYTRSASFGLLFLCALLKFSQDDTSSLYYNGIGQTVTVAAAEFCPNSGGGRPYLATVCATTVSPRFKRTLGRMPPGNYTISQVDAEYGNLSTRYIYVVDTPKGPARVDSTQVAVRWPDGAPVDEADILKDVPRWLSMLMFYPQLPLVLLQAGKD